MNKAVLVTSALVSLIVLPAAAADLRAPAKAPAPVYQAACANFGGLYFGGHGGWTYYKQEWSDLDNYGFSIFDLDNTGNGSSAGNSWHGGAQIGYNYQAGCAVFGLQADWSWTGAKASSLFRDDVGPGEQSLQAQSKMQWFGTVRARTGVAVNSLLLYVTGGLAYANIKREFTFDDGIGNSQLFGGSSTRWGFAAGAGTEWAINNNWSLTSEFLYLGFQKDKKDYNCSNVNTCGAVVGAPYRFEHTDSAWVTRIGLNYRFNAAPVVARY
jgi:outer membrane immunogenic protein